ncbi:MAG: type II secretion system F family protein [Anaerohalosphaeraceae bacterium]
MSFDIIISILVFVVAISLVVLFVRMAFRRPIGAMISSFAGSVIFLISGIMCLIGYDEYEWGFASVVCGITLFAMSALSFPLTLIVLCFCPVRDKENGYPRWRVFARWTAAILLLIILLTVLILCFNIFGVIFSAMLIAGVIHYFSVSRYNNVLEFVSIIGSAMRQNLPLPAALRAAAAGRSDKMSFIFCQTSKWLTQGYSLAQAVRRGYPRCLPEVLLAIESAEKLNQLPNILISLEKDLVNQSDETRKIRPSSPWYPVIVMILICSIVLGLCIFIIPTFSEVITDMSDGKANLPPSTQLLMTVSRNLLHPEIYFILGLVVELAVFVWAYYFFRTRIAYKKGWFLNIFDRIRWYWPLHRQLERKSSMLRLVEILRAGIHAGRPLDQILDAAAELKINVCFQKRIACWLQRIRQGENPSDSARFCGIGQGIAWAMDSDLNPGQTPVLLETLEEVYRSEMNYIGNLIRAILWPFLILGMGLFVGFIVYSMFMPIVSVITTGIQFLMP